MPYFIATVWTVSTDQHGVTEHRRVVTRLRAVSVQDFKDQAIDQRFDEVRVGPVSLSKDQSQ